MTFTTLVPPPLGSDCSRKYQEMLSWPRVMNTQASQATPAPAATASAASRALRPVLDSRGVVCGNSARPISSSTVDTTSTDNCVSARSGAESDTKASATTRPTMPTSTTVRKRSWWPSTSAAQVTSSSAQTTTAKVLAGIRARSPVPTPPPSKGAAATTMAPPTIRAR